MPLLRVIEGGKGRPSPPPLKVDLTGIYVRITREGVLFLPAPQKHLYLVSKKVIAHLKDSCGYHKIPWETRTQVEKNYCKEDVYVMGIYINLDAADRHFGVVAKKEEAGFTMGVGFISNLAGRFERAGIVHQVHTCGVPRGESVMGHRQVPDILRFEGIGIILAV